VAALVEMDRAGLKTLLDGFCANRLADGGVWFQAVEFKDGLNECRVQSARKREEELLFPAMEQAGVARDGGPIGAML
jgi:hypothetical protein